MRRKISAGGRVKIAVFLTAYAMVHATTRWFAATQIDRGKIVYEMETPPGVVLHYARFVAAVWFFRSAVTTMRNFPDNKRRFYRKYTVVFGVWFTFTVTLTWVSAAMPDYFRAKFTFAGESCLLFIAHALLTVMYNPEIEVGGGFPFHGNDGTEVMTGRVRGGEGREERGGRRRRERERERERDGKCRRYAFGGDGGDNDNGGSNNGGRNNGGRGEREEQGGKGGRGEGEGSGEAAAALKGGGGESPNRAVSPSPSQSHRPLSPRQLCTFRSVPAAMDAVRDTGDDVSTLLHRLTFHLETLDDAMDDWDAGNVHDEEGEDYDDLAESSERDERREGGGLPVHGTGGG